MKLSKYFTYQEMIKTSVDLPNKPNARELVNIMFMCSQVLDPIRDEFGKPIIVNSGFRTDLVNKAVGGVFVSRHTLGLAADIRPVDQSDFVRLMTICHSFQGSSDLVDDVIVYDTFIHIELKGGVTNEVDRNC